MTVTDQDRRQEALAVAGGRPGRHRARRAGAETARQTGRQAPLAQAAEEAGPAAARHGHGQAGELSGRQEGTDARRRAPPPQGPEQPGREFTPADPKARAPDEAVQVTPPGATVPLRPRPD